MISYMLRKIETIGVTTLRDIFFTYSNRLSEMKASINDLNSVLEVAITSYDEIVSKTHHIKGIIFKITLRNDMDSNSKHLIRHSIQSSDAIEPYLDITKIDFSRFIEPLGKLSDALLIPDLDYAVKIRGKAYLEPK